MSMNFLSLQTEKKRTKTFADLFELGDWKIKKTVIISAYTDIESIKEIVTYVSKHADKTSSSIQIFMDKAASRVSTDEELSGELQKLNKKIEKYFSKGSGIFLVSYGKLFHSKCYIFEGRKEGKFFIGSMNLTVAGRENNEEILVGANYTCNTKEANARLAEKLFKYADELKANKRGKAYSASDIEDYENKSVTFRDIILDGFLYTESKEASSFFSIELKLPKEFKYMRTDINFFGAEYTDSISIEKIAQCHCEACRKNKKTKFLWKEYCIATCYGYWSPAIYSAEIKDQLEQKKSSKQYYINIREYLNSSEQFIKKVFLETIDKIKNKTIEANLPWKFDAEEKWTKWYKRTCRKMENEKFIEKLATNVQCVPCLDVWIEPNAAENFIESFSEFVNYTQEKDSGRNKPAKALINNLGRQQNLNPEDLVKSIEKWIAKNPDSNIFSLKD